MGRTEKVDLQEEEILAETVRKYPCLYDKSSVYHKDKRKVANSWRAVTEELGYEEG